MTQTPETPNNRLDRLEAALGRFAELTIQNVQRHDEAIANVSESVLAQSDTIDVLVSNISQLTENVNRLNNTVDNLTIAVNRSSQNIDSLTAQAAEDRQQAAIDRQTWQSEIQRIWQYLERQTGNGRGNA